VGKVQATGEAVDLANWMITLKLPKGIFGDFKVDEHG